MLIEINSNNTKGMEKKVKITFDPIIQKELLLTF